MPLDAPPSDNDTDSGLESLTCRQREIYEFIREKIRDRGFPPTVREIGDEFAIKSPNGVMAYLKVLQEMGLIYRDKERSREIQVLGESEPRNPFPGYTHLSLELSDKLAGELLDLTAGRDEGLEDVLRKAIGLFKAAAKADKEGKAVGIAASPEVLETQFVDF